MCTHIPSNQHCSRASCRHADTASAAAAALPTAAAAAAATFDPSRPSGGSGSLIMQRLAGWSAAAHGAASGTQGQQGGRRLGDLLNLSSRRFGAEPRCFAVGGLDPRPAALARERRCRAQLAEIEQWLRHEPSRRADAASAPAGHTSAASGDTATTPAPQPSSTSSAATSSKSMCIIIMDSDGISSSGNSSSSNISSSSLNSGSSVIGGSRTTSGSSDCATPTECRAAAAASSGKTDRAPLDVSSQDDKGCVHLVSRRQRRRRGVRCPAGGQRRFCVAPLRRRLRLAAEWEEVSTAGACSPMRAAAGLPAAPMAAPMMDGEIESNGTNKEDEEEETANPASDSNGEETSAAIINSSESDEDDSEEETAAIATDNSDNEEEGSEETSVAVINSSESEEDDSEDVTAAITTDNSDNEEEGSEETSVAVINSSDNEEDGSKETTAITTNNSGKEEEGEQETTATAASDIAGKDDDDELDAFLARLATKTIEEDYDRDPDDDFVTMGHCLLLDEWMEDSAVEAFWAGEQLGKGAFGAVHKVEIDGVAYALKRSTYINPDGHPAGGLWGLQRSGFVQVPLCSFVLDDHDGGAEYTLYPLARGTLSAAVGVWAKEPQQQQEQPAGAQQAPQGKLGKLRGAVRRLLGKARSGSRGADGSKSSVTSGAKSDDQPDAAAMTSSSPSDCDPLLEEMAAAERATAFQAIAAEMCAAVALLHGARDGNIYIKGFRHGDIKPSNFLVARDGHVRLADLDGVCPASQAATPHDMCSRLYAPPEQQLSRFERLLRRLPPRVRAAVKAVTALVERWRQRSEDEPADSRSVDVWALGMSWLHMLLQDEHLRRVFHAVHGASKKPAAAAAAAAAMAEAHAALLPPGLADLVFGGMLRRDPRERLTIAQVAAHPFFSGVDWAAVGARRTPLPVDLCARLAAA